MRETLPMSVAELQELEEVKGLITRGHHLGVLIESARVAAEARIRGLAQGWSIVYQRTRERVKATLEAAIAVSSRAWRGTRRSI